MRILHMLGLKHDWTQPAEQPGSEGFREERHCTTCEAYRYRWTGQKHWTWNGRYSSGTWGHKRW